MGDVLGYARVSTDDQDLEGQRRRLKKADATRIFEDVISGKRFERPGLNQLLDYARPDDCLCVVRLDRLERSLRELLEVVDMLKERRIHLPWSSRSLWRLVTQVLGLALSPQSAYSPAECKGARGLARNRRGTMHSRTKRPRDARRNA